MMKILLVNLVFLFFQGLIPLSANEVRIINVSNQPLHLSYEDKFGEIQGLWIPAKETKTILLDSPKKRITFERDTNLFPCIVKGGDVLNVGLTGSVYKIYNSEIAEHYYTLSEKYAILKTPFSGIEYSSKTDYTEILKEIDRYKKNRLGYIQGLKDPNPELNIIIELKYIDELLSPIHSQNYTEINVPPFYKNAIDKSISKLPELKMKDEDFDLVKQYFLGILKYKILENGLVSPKSKIDFINSTISNNYLRYYLVWKLYDLEKLMPESKEKYMEYFELCLDKDYINRIMEIEKGWMDF